MALWPTAPLLCDDSIGMSAGEIRILKELVADLKVGEAFLGFAHDADPLCIFSTPEVLRELHDIV